MDLLEFVGLVVEMRTPDEEDSAARLAKELSEIMENASWANNKIMVMALAGLLLMLYKGCEKELQLFQRKAVQ